MLLWNITSVDHSNTQVEATALLLGGSLTAQIDPGNDVDYFSIPIEGRGQLTLWTTTTGFLDTIGILQNNDGTTLATTADDNGDEALMLCVCLSLSVALLSGCERVRDMVMTDEMVTPSSEKGAGLIVNKIYTLLLSCLSDLEFWTWICEVCNDSGMVGGPQS